MELLILRHGLAADRESWMGNDADRPLTRAGVTRTRKVMRAHAKRYQPQSLWSSPWQRARQTADLAAEVWSVPVTEQAWLAGGASTPASATRKLITCPTKRLMIIGHEPDLSLLAGHLIGGPPLPLKKAGLAVLHGTMIEGGMELRALLHPALVLDLAHL